MIITSTEPDLLLCLHHLSLFYSLCSYQIHTSMPLVPTVLSGKEWTWRRNNSIPVCHITTTTSHNHHHHPHPHLHHQSSTLALALAQ
jgi:hypothetical protein